MEINATSNISAIIAQLNASQSTIYTLDQQLQALEQETEEGIAFFKAEGNTTKASEAETILAKIQAIKTNYDGGTLSAKDATSQMNTEIQALKALGN